MSFLSDKLERDGRLPPINLQVNPVDGSAPFIFPRYKDDTFSSGFLSYEFDSNILIPVDSFSFSFAAPQDITVYGLIKDGDVVRLLANSIVIATGIVDSVEIAIDADRGEIATIRGRDLMSQLEDQSAINDQDSPIWVNGTSIKNVAQILIRNTRIQKVITSSTPPGSKYLFPTEPGESKLSALTRFLEPLNCLTWMSPEGFLTIGKPDFIQDSRDKLYLSKERREANITSARVIRNATQIPNVVLPIWSGQELAQNQVSPKQKIINTAQRPRELNKAGHRVPKTIVVSHPQGFDPVAVNNITVARYNAKDLLESYALKEIARANVGELNIEVEVPGHYDTSGRPYSMNTVFDIEIDRADIRKKMYCYSARYMLDEGKGQSTILSFCNLGTIVSDVRAP